MRKAYEAQFVRRHSLLLCYTVLLMTTSSTMNGAYWQNGVAFPLTVDQELSPLIEMDVGSRLKAVSFTANGEHIVGSGNVNLECGEGQTVKKWQQWQCGVSALSLCRRMADGSQQGHPTAMRLCGTQRHAHRWRSRFLARLEQHPRTPQLPSGMLRLTKKY